MNRIVVVVPYSDEEVLAVGGSAVRHTVIGDYVQVLIGPDQFTSRINHNNLP